MDLSRPLTVITPTVDADVLAVLAGADASFTGRQVHQISGRHSEKGVRNALQRLCAQGVVTRRRAGPSDLYALNRSHLAAPYIVALAGLRTELNARIVEAVAAWPIQPAFAALFGSTARGDTKVDSDIDLFVVRPYRVDVEHVQWGQQLRSLTDLVTGWTGNDARILELDQQEVRSALVAGERILTDIRNEGFVLAGPRDFLRAALGKSSGDGVADTKRCTPATQSGRLSKAQQFLVAAETVATIIDDREIADAYVTLCVHVGIAAADAICCAKLGVHHEGQDHTGAVSMLATVDKAAAKQLHALLGMMTRSGYSEAPTPAADQKRAGRAAMALVRAAELVGAQSVPGRRSTSASGSPL